MLYLSYNGVLHLSYNMTDTITIRPTANDKERITLINQHTNHKTATQAIRAALQAYADAVQKRVEREEATWHFEEYG